MDARARVDRRGFLVLTAGLLATSGCDPTADGPAGPGAHHTSGRTTSPSPPAGRSSGTSPPSPFVGSAPLPTVSAWTPDSTDVMPGVKAQAARLVEALGSWPVDGQGIAAAAARARTLGQDGRLAGQAGPLLTPSPAAAVHVLAVQYGGILPGRASVLVACRQWRGGPGRQVSSGGTTVDVRLEAAQPHWRVTELRPARPGPPGGRVSALAREVLGADRIELPPAARADVLAGRVHDGVLRALLRLSASYRIGVSVIRSGHPLHVFGTSRVSDHSRGRAFDTYRIDGRLVVHESTPRDLVTGYMRAAVAAGSYNVGGPYLPPEPGAAFFSSPTHHDHVHAGFRI